MANSSDCRPARRCHDLCTAFAVPGNRHDNISLTTLSNPAYLATRRLVCATLVHSTILHPKHVTVHRIINTSQLDSQHDNLPKGIRTIKMRKLYSNDALVTANGLASIVKENV